MFAYVLVPQLRCVGMYICVFISAVCIDRYTELRVKLFDGVAESAEIDSRLEDIVMRMFERCLANRRYKQAIGIAFETRRIDVIERALYESVRQWVGR